MDRKDNIAKRVEMAFRSMWPITHQKNLLDFAEEFTDMREVETINFLSIYLLGVTRNVEDVDLAWSQAFDILEQILLDKIKF